MSLRTFASAWYPPKRVRFVGTPMSRHHRGITLLIGGEWARARVPSGVVARGNVWGQSSALEVLASHLPPNARPSRKQCRRGVRAVAAGCSGGRRGAAGSGAPALARHCAVPVRRGWETGAGERHGHNQKCRVTKTILLSGVVSAPVRFFKTDPPRSYFTQISNTVRPPRLCLWSLVPSVPSHSVLTWYLRGSCGLPWLARSSCSRRPCS